MAADQRGSVLPAEGRAGSEGRERGARGRRKRAEMPSYWHQVGGAAPLWYGPEASFHPPSPLPSNLPPAEGEPRFGSCQKGEEDQARRPQDVGEQPLGRGREHRLASRRSRMEAEGGGEEEEGGQELVFGKYQKEEKEKEEGEEEGKRGEGRTGVSREDAHRRTGQRQKDSSSAVCWDRLRPESQPQEEAFKESEEGFEEEPGIDEFYKFLELGDYQRAGSRHALGGQEQSSQDCLLGPRLVGGTERGANEAVPHSSGWHWVGARRGDSSPNLLPLQPNLYGNPVDGWSGTRIFHPGMGGRSLASSAPFRSVGCGAPTDEVHRTDGSRDFMEHGAKAGVSAAHRRPDRYSTGVPDRETGSQAGFGREGNLWRSREREIEGKRKEPERERKRQRKAERRRGEEEWLEEFGAMRPRGYEAPRGAQGGKEESEEVKRRLGEKESPGEGESQRKKEGGEREETRIKTPQRRSAERRAQRTRRTQRKAEEKKKKRTTDLVGQVGKTTIIKRRKRRRTSRTSERQKSERFSETGRPELPAGSFSWSKPAATGSDPFECTVAASEMLRPDDLGIGQVCPEKTVTVDLLHPGWGLGDILNWLDSREDDLMGPLCKTLAMGRLFPLPSSPFSLNQLFPRHDQGALLVLRWLVWSLNSLNGEGVEGPEVASEYQQTVLRGLLLDSERAAAWKMEGKVPSWTEFFRVKGVDYKGEEVLTAQEMRWENVAPALPREVGTVPLESVVELGCKHYVLHFEDYLLDPEDQVAVRPPRVLVPPDNWREFCANLLQMNIFSKVHEDDIYQVGGRPLLNGLFGVSKNEFDGGVELQRIIMNLIPLNGVVQSLDGDVGTLPSWAGMAPLHLQPHEDLLVSSEDVRAFFYIFRVPTSWHRFLCFNRPLPEDLCGERPGRWYPCSAVLPMGFKNSVSLAQHVHRFVVKHARAQCGQQGGEAELRKDKVFSTANPLHRIYLDNFDELEKVSKDTADAISGKASALVSSLQETYSSLGIPRHPKKGVARQPKAEVQGALVDGSLGVAIPKWDKVLRYAYLARILLEEGRSSQKQMQVVGGGFVYAAMFRRPLLGSLNHIWQFIVSCTGYPAGKRFKLPAEVRLELARFIGLLPLAYMDFRCQVSPVVTASDASEMGGGVTASEGLTELGAVASSCEVRGDLVEPCELTSVLTIGLFDGIAALRVATDSLGWNVVGHVSVEKSKEARRVVESRFPGCIFIEDVTQVDLNMVQTWAQRFSQVSLVVLGAGPPCQGVSGLNASRKGALKDERSSLFSHASRIRSLVQQCFPWAQVQGLMENVASMDSHDEQVMAESFGSNAWYIDAAGVSIAHRPRLYWVDWELRESADATFGATSVGRQSVSLKAQIETGKFLTPGWKPVSEGPFPTFTTSRPRSNPGYKPAGIHQCNEEELERWKTDSYRFPPYQYQNKHCVQNRRGVRRLLNIQEREVAMGFPKDFTSNSVPKTDQGSKAHLDARLSLIGNSWNVTVVSWLLSQLGQTLGLNDKMSVQDIFERTSPGCSRDLQTFLQRPPMGKAKESHGNDKPLKLVHKLLTLVSVKGEDISLQSSSEDLVKYQRLRASVPAKLWRWYTAASWKWTGCKEHINSLEMRAVLTALRWRLERHKKVHVKFVHLVDSLVAMHSLSRGRSSSRKLRRTVLKINALLLATRSQSVWAYVHTKDNPADAPSRRPRKQKWK